MQAKPSFRDMPSNAECTMKMWGGRVAMPGMRKKHLPIKTGPLGALTCSKATAIQKLRPPSAGLS